MSILDNKQLRVIVLTHGEAEGLLQSLSKLDCVNVVGVFVETNVNRRVYGLREKLRRSVRYDGYAATAAKVLRSILRRNRSPVSETNRIRERQQDLGGFAERLNMPVHYLQDFHLEESIAAMRRADADLGIVWGTNILKKSVFKIPRLGSINIHQGLAPYYRGGPPVFWELYNDESVVGITVHFVESKVDTGEILVQKTMPLVYDYAYGLDFNAFISDFCDRMMEHCIQAMTEAVRRIADGTAQPRPQDISLGNRYRLPVKREKDELRRRLRLRQRQHQRQTAVTNYGL